MPNLFGRASAVAADHVHLRDTCRRLGEEFRASGGAGKRENAWLLVGEFASELRAHFAAEEAGGYFGALVEQQPQLHTQVEQLRAEHRLITAFLEQLLGAGEDALISGKVDAQVRELLDRFQRHERAEALLIQDFFGRDEGGEGA